MSDLKYRSADELRSLIKWCVQKRQEKDQLKRKKQDEVKCLENEIHDLGKQSHNIGQKEAWARIYLAWMT